MRSSRFSLWRQICPCTSSVSLPDNIFATAIYLSLERRRERERGRHSDGRENWKRKINSLPFSLSLFSSCLKVGIKKTIRSNRWLLFLNEALGRLATFFSPYFLSFLRKIMSLTLAKSQVLCRKEEEEELTADSAFSYFFSRKKHLCPKHFIFGRIKRK